MKFDTEVPYKMSSKPGFRDSRLSDQILPKDVYGFSRRFFFYFYIRKLQHSALGHL
jgi:hypothetical protein